ncbi:MAG TPA: glycosyltransferase family 4 protein [Tepidisphaeraceae bacterium]|nr:glycosyltransferase family 4 protein [Tepidisphaeraceae bacterium]
MKNAKLKVGIAHVCMGRGGSEARASWGIQALRGEYDVSLITTAGVDVEQINRFYGTSLSANDFELRLAPPPFGMQRAFSAAAIRGSLFQRFCSSIAPEFDVLISAYNPCDFGAAAIQFIADFSWHERLREEFDPKPPQVARILNRPGPFRAAYLSLSRAIGKPSGRNLFGGDDCFIANSHWTADTMRQRCGVNCEVLYPPVVLDSVNVEWNQREFGFVCVGRITYEKRIDRVIEIISRVRQLGHDVHLHIVGGIDDSPYGAMIRSVCENNRSWIIVEGEKSGKEKAELMSRHRFGIHGRPFEAFGIAVAEMVKAGCIPFVPNTGGQVEIVEHPALCCGDVDHAVKQIDAVIRDEKLCREIREHLQARGARFSAQIFMDGFRQIVERFVARGSMALAS